MLTAFLKRREFRMPLRAVLQQEAETLSLLFLFCFFFFVG